MSSSLHQASQPPPQWQRMQEYYCCLLSPDCQQGTAHTHCLPPKKTPNHIRNFNMKRRPFLLWWLKSYVSAYELKLPFQITTNSFFEVWMKLQLYWINCTFKTSVKRLYDRALSQSAKNGSVKCWLTFKAAGYPKKQEAGPFKIEAERQMLSEMSILSWI